MKDPNAAAKMEAKMEHMLKVGDEQMKKGAGAAMEEAVSYERLLRNRYHGDILSHVYTRWLLWEILK